MSEKNKNSYWWLIFLIVIIVIITVFIIFKDKVFPENNSENSLNNVARLAQESNIPSTDDLINKLQNVTVSEEEISSYSTKLGGSTENRLTNIRITCEKLNGTVVKKGDTFSFCDSTGPSTADEGYKEATVFLDGKKVQALGGGNCQISSTLYNAVLAVPELEVVERHEHGQNVSYVPDGKDAAVAYGSIDFKFQNNTENAIKLYFSTDDSTLTVRIVKLSV